MKLPFKGQEGADPLIIDGAHGEGGGQILRTALSLSVITSRAFRLIDIRAKRRNPGLLPQHLSATRAAAAISGATLEGDQLGSREIVFAPTHSPQGGCYHFDVAEIAGRGSAGSAILILQTVLVPLAFAQGDSMVVALGGTHQDWAPAYDDFADTYLPVLRRMGFRVDAELARWGWYPAGGGEVIAKLKAGPDRDWPRASWPSPIDALGRGPLLRITGRAVAANLPAHIPQRMSDRARAALGDLGVPVQIEPLRVRAMCPGAGIFLLAEYETLSASFSALGRHGKPSEAVADEAVTALREHHASRAAVELHLADQLLLPLAFAAGPSVFTLARPTAHLATNAWTIEQFGLAEVRIEPGPLCRVEVLPSAANVR